MSLPPIALNVCMPAASFKLLNVKHGMTNKQPQTFNFHILMCYIITFYSLYNFGSGIFFFFLTPQYSLRPVVHQGWPGFGGKQYIQFL